MSDLVLPDRPSSEATVSMIAMLRERHVLGPTYGDFSILFRGDEDEEAVYERLSEIAHFLGASYDSLRWAIADFLLFGEGLIGDRFYQIVEILGIAESTALDYLRVGMKVPRSRRKIELTFSHHRAVAKLEPEAQTLYLDRAIGERLSTRELGEKIKSDKAKEAQGDDGRHEIVEIVRIRVDRSILSGLVHAAQPLGDGRYAVPEEGIVRLRAAIGEGE